MMWDGTEHCATMKQCGGPTRATSVEKKQTQEGGKEADSGTEGKRQNLPGKGDGKANCKKKRGEEAEKVYKKFVYSGESLYLHHLDTYFHNLNQINYGR